MRPRSRVVVRLVVIGRRKLRAVGEHRERREHVEAAPARVHVAPDRALHATGCAGDVIRASLEQPRDLVRGELRIHAEQQRRRRRDLRRRERRPDRIAKLERPAVGVRPVRALRGRDCELPRNRGEDVLAGSGDVVEHGVTIREGRDRPVLTESADADHVWQRSGIVREVPRRRRRLRPVPDGGDDEHALRVRILDRRLFERRIRVELRVERVANPTQAQVDHTCALVHGPSDRRDLGRKRDGPVRLDDFRDDQPRIERDAGDPDAVERVRRDLAGDERPVPVLVAKR